MKNFDLKNRTKKELESLIKIMKGISAALILSITLLFILSIYGIVLKENKAIFIALLVIALASVAILPLQLKTIKTVKDELNNRE
ncbi:MAG: hypothetical protein CR968_04925 [Flavobacteriia bacterium]|nr:MAG: hypothetical protein CR968_04925 [Flavobacteriia bacterium]